MEIGMRNIMKKNQPFSWKKLLILTVLLSFFYVFMEWVFFVTKPSFMSEMSLVSKAGVFFTTGGVIALLSFVVIFALFAINSLLVRLKVITNIPSYLALSLPSAFLAALALILLDNFTYTVFKFGVVSLPYLLRGVYALGFVLGFFYFVRWTFRFVSDANAKPQKQMLVLTGVLSVISILSILGQFQMPLQQETGTAGVNKRPNVLIIGSDGVNAENMSVYGYGRKTTPNLEKLSPDFLVAENAFTNGGGSRVSIVSILTGKLSTQTDVSSANNILLGADSYQHLPGILRSLGYFNVQFGVPHFIDSYEVNLQNGFDVVNGRSYDQKPFFQMTRKIGLNEASYFLSTTFERASSRIFHIFYIREMQNPMEAVTTPGDHAGLSDHEKVTQIIDLVESAQSPIFIQAHLMGTHGNLFNPAHRVFSLNEEQHQDWMGDFYDDAILDFDLYVKEIVDALSKSGKLDNTILVIYTDHNMLWRTNQRIPLMIRFPKGEWAGHVGNNVQNIDIAPTILDYLGIDRPIWINGQSFLRDDPPQNRLIQSGDDVNYIKVIQCNRWYRFSLRDGAWSTAEVTGHTVPCEHQEIVSKTNIPADIGNYLAANGVKIQDRPDNNDVYLSLFATRGKIAPILLQKIYGMNFIPPPAQGIFSDVPASDPNISSIEQLYHDGIIGSCSSSPLSYCADQIVTREELAVILLKTVEGSDYKPPAAKGIFADVPVSSPFAPWIEELYARGITVGCGVAPLSYCPSEKLFGEHFEIFIKRTFP